MRACTGESHVRTIKEDWSAIDRFPAPLYDVTDAAR
jgi:hypothetical protein